MKEQILNAIAVHNVGNYHTNPAGIGEHPDIVAEAIKLIEAMESAESNLQTLNEAYGTSYTTEM